MKDRLRKLSKQTFIYGTSTVIGRFVNFILVPFYTNVFPPSEYGVIAVIFAYTAFFNVIYNLGFEAGYFRFASETVGNEKKKSFSIAFFTILLNSTFLSLLIIIFSTELASLTEVNNTSFIVYTALILFLDALCLIPFAFLRLSNKSYVFALIKLLNIVVNVSCNLLLILVFRYGLEAVFISNTAASLLTLLMLSPYIIRNISFTFDKNLYAEITKFSLPYLPAGIAAMLIQVVDKPIIQFISGKEALGIYNANYKLGILMMIIVSMFEYAWRPFFLNHYRDEDAKKLFSKVFTYFVGFCSVVFVLITIFIENIVRIPLPYRGHLIGESYWGGVTIVPVILLAYIFLGMYTNFISGIYIEKKSRYLPLVNGVAAALNILICFILIPHIGIMGGAVATLVSYLVMASFIYFLSQRFYPVQYESGRVMVIILIDLICLIVFFSLLNSHESFLIKIISCIILVSLVVYTSGLYKAHRLFIRNQ
ncbi:MAG: oligosaccharide flippase family protein [Ignavibacteria bacterium]|nr:oligosaccharide flippase family protein [Ignavibacteria bacterium]